MHEGKTILLVEDEITTAQTEKMFLEDYGYRVVVAHTGEDAVSAAAGIPDLDLILMDINLGPGIDGTQAAQTILKTRDIPILFLSSHTESDVIERTEKITSYGYVVKHSSMTALDASIKMAFKLFEAQQALRSSRAKLEATLNALPDLLLEVDRDGYIFDGHAPRATTEVIAIEKLIGKKMPAVAPPAIWAAVDRALGEADRNGASTGTWYESTGPRGTFCFELSIAKKPLTDPKEAPRFVILRRDITERKKMEDELRANEIKYQLVFEHSGTSNSIFDTQCRLIMQNKMSKESLGDLGGGALAAHVLQIFGPQLGATIEERMRRVIAKQEAETFEAEFDLKSGKKWFRSIYQPIVNEKKETVCVQIVSQDITTVKEAEKSLQILNDELEERVKERTLKLQESMAQAQRFQQAVLAKEKLASLSPQLAAIAHELNNPLGNISMLCSAIQERRQRLSRPKDPQNLAKERAALDEFMDQSLNLIAKSATLASILVKSFKKVTSDRQGAQKHLFNLSELAQDCVRLIQTNPGGRAQTLELAIPPELTLNSYPGPLGQVLENLIRNAMIHAFDPGKIGIICVRAQVLGADQATVRLEVSDNGHGIPLAHRARVFDPFFSTRLDQDGSGLGLSIVSELVHGTLGGTIELHTVATEDGPEAGPSGTTFILTLPSDYLAV